MELIKNRWSVSPKELKRLQTLDKSDLMAIIKSFKIGTGKLSRKKLEKDVYNSIAIKKQPKKVYKTSTRKRSKPDNTEGQEDS